MDAEQKQFVDWLLSNCQTHERWLTVVRYGLPTLLDDQDVLFEIVANEAKRTAELHEPTMAALQRIMGELGLRFTAG